jgi:HK97 family phage portal protein
MEQKFEVDVLTGQSNILHLKTFNPSNDYYGMSPLEAAAYGVDVHNAASNWNKSLFDNAARPSGALIYEPKEGSSTLSNDQFTRLKHEMEENFQGSRNAGRPLLLEGGLKWQQIAFSPADMDFINAKHVSAREIALAFGVPPMLLSIPGDNTYSNYREANRALWRTAVLPCVEKIITALNIWLLPLFEAGLRLEIDLDSIVELSSDREAYWQRIGAADFMTINEKRAAVGLKSVAGGDELK